MFGLTLDLINLIILLIIGGLAGFVAGRIWQGRGFGIVVNIILGIVGAIIMGVIFNVTGIGKFIPDFFYIEYFIAGVLGALLLILIGRMIKRS